MQYFFNIYAACDWFRRSLHPAEAKVNDVTSDSDHVFITMSSPKATSQISNGWGILADPTDQFAWEFSAMHFVANGLDMTCVEAFLCTPAEQGLKPCPSPAELVSDDSYTRPPQCSIRDNHCPASSHFSLDAVPHMRDLEEAQSAPSSSSLPFSSCASSPSRTDRTCGGDSCCSDSWTLSPISSCSDGSSSDAGSGSDSDSGGQYEDRTTANWLQCSDAVMRDHKDPPAPAQADTTNVDAASASLSSEPFAVKGKPLPAADATAALWAGTGGCGNPCGPVSSCPLEKAEAGSCTDRFSGETVQGPVYSSWGHDSRSCTGAPSAARPNAAADCELLLPAGLAPMAVRTGIPGSAALTAGEVSEPSTPTPSSVSVLEADVDALVGLVVWGALWGSEA